MHPGLVWMAPSCPTHPGTGYLPATLRESKYDLASNAIAEVNLGLAHAKVKCTSFWARINRRHQMPFPTLLTSANETKEQEACRSPDFLCSHLAAL